MVWVNFHASDPNTALDSPDDWIPVPGAFAIDEQQAEMRFSAANLWLDSSVQKGEPNPNPQEDTMIHAYIHGTFMVAVTCTVAGDFRLYHDPILPGSSILRNRYAITDHGFETFRFVDRSHNVFANKFVVDDDPEFSERDDTQRLQRFGDQDVVHRQVTTVAGSLDVFWIDHRYRMGDGFSGADGLGVYFHAFPAIRRIQYTKGWVCTSMRSRRSVASNTPRCLRGTGRCCT